MMLLTVIGLGCRECCALDTDVDRGRMGTSFVDADEDFSLEFFFDRPDKTKRELTSADRL